MSTAPFAPVNVTELAREVLAEYAPIAAARGVDLGLTERRCGVELRRRRRRERLRTLLSNLVDNALRHTPAGGRVDVACASATARHALTVRDSGPGIPASEREHVFDRFVPRPGDAAAA